MSAPGKGAYTDGGVGFTQSMGKDGKTYVRVIQVFKNGKEFKRSTFAEGGVHVRTHIYGWSDGNAFVQEEILDDSISLDAMLGELAAEGYELPASV